MCHDINPLGTVMHLRELDRQAEKRLVSVSASSEPGPRAGQHNRFSIHWRAVTMLTKIEWKQFFPRLLSHGPNSYLRVR
jgi:hypothetical protein